VRPFAYGSWGLNKVLRIDNSSGIISEVPDYEHYTGFVVLDYTRKHDSDLSKSYDQMSFRVRVVYEYYDLNNVLQSKELTINHDRGHETPDVYLDYAKFAVPTSAKGFSVRIKSFFAEYLPNDASLTWIPVTDASLYPFLNDLELRLELKIDVSYPLTVEGLQAEKNSLVFTPIDYTLRWDYIQGAEQYDVEWVYIDDHSVEYTQLTNSLSPNPFDLKECSRVRVWNTYFQLDKTYSSGKIFFRVRPVGYFATSDKISDDLKLGAWSYYANGPSAIEIVSHTITESEAFENDKNWKYGIAYAEGGKSVSSITFYDGSNRGRQSKTYNTSDDVSLVSETKFDYEGRQTISVIPAPVKGRKLGYQANFNLALDGGIFDENDFDDPTKVADPLKTDGITASGAAQYFSSNNTFTDDMFRAAIPEANGYVYSQTIYRNDGSGRIEGVGGIGEEFKATGDHAVQTFYGTPLPTDLKRLFGSNVPDDLTGYRKDMVRDANGQYSVTYYDKRGHVIATGLAGDAPSNLKPIGDLPIPATYTTPLASNNVKVDDYTLVSENTFLNEIPDNPISLSYSLTGVVNQMINEEVSANGASTSFGTMCSTCRYTLEISILNQQGENVLTPPSFHEINPASLCTDGVSSVGVSNVGHPIVIHATLSNLGEYRIIKTLRVNVTGMRQDLETKLSVKAAENKTTFITNYTSNLDYASCYSTCEEYIEEKYRYAYEKEHPTLKWANTDLATKARFKEGIDYEKYCTQSPTDFSSKLEEEDKAMTDCDNYRGLMLNQIKSGGLFYYDFWNNTGNGWGNVTAFTETKLGLTPKTYSIDELKIMSTWSTDMEDHLLKFHREYCHLQQCIALNSQITASRDYTFKLTQSIKGISWGLSRDIVLHPYSNVDLGTDPFHVSDINTSFQDNERLQARIDNFKAIYLDYLDDKGNTLSTQIGLVTALAGSNSLVTVVDELVEYMFASSDPSLVAQQTQAAQQLGVSVDKDTQKKMMFLSFYAKVKSDMIDEYKASHNPSCSYYTDNNAVFIKTKDNNGITKEVVKGLSDLTNNSPEKCSQLAYSSTKQWLSQISSSCLTTLPYTSVFTEDDLKDHLAVHTGNIEQYFYDYVVATCGNSTEPNIYGQFYNPGEGNPGYSAYESIETMLTGTACASSWPFTFSVTKPTFKEIKVDYATVATADMLIAMQELVAQTFTNAGELNKIPKIGSNNSVITLSDKSYGSSNSDHGDVWWVSGKNNVALSNGYLGNSHLNYRYIYDYSFLNLNNEFRSDFEISTTVSKNGCDYTMYYYQQVNRRDFIQDGTFVPNGEKPYGNLKFTIQTTFGNTIQDVTSPFLYTITSACPTSVNTLTYHIPSLPQGAEDPFTVSFTQADLTAACKEEKLGEATIDAEKLYAKAEDDVRSLHAQQRATCIGSVTETMTLTYQTNEYQYTLYYYDLAGNLVQTVPPQGVEILTSEQLALKQDPNHRMETRYTYNGLNTLLAQYTPDGGRTDFYLDKLYRVRFSQNARQLPEGKSSYSLYDELGRVTEAGEFTILTGFNDGTIENASNYLRFIDTWESGHANDAIANRRLDYTQTMYEDVAPEQYTSYPIASQFTNGQQNLRNAIGAILHSQVLDAASNTRTTSMVSYSYDAHKNVKEVVNSNFILQGLGYPHTKVSYDYDLLSGKVNEVNYQQGKADALNHRYQYDANNRLIRTFTSRNGDFWEMDAKYFYYLHGALARTELGHDKVQGVDYAYNLQGWLKGVNSVFLDRTVDLGKDASISSSNTTPNWNRYFGADAFSFSLGYFQGDYQAIDATSTAFGATDGLRLKNGQYGNLYNGNIPQMTTHFMDETEGYKDALGYNYTYDQLQRIRSVDAYARSTSNTASNAFTFENAKAYNNGAYMESYTYDKNGNISSLKRNNNLGVLQDDFTYLYYQDITQTPITGNTPLHRNQLASVQDGVINSSSTNDIESGQVDNNYQYDASGQLIKDLQEGIQKIEWTATGKVKKINYTTSAKTIGVGGNIRKDIQFVYDPMDIRIAKITYNNEAHSDVSYAFYTHDAQGNMMATYAYQEKYTPRVEHAADGDEVFTTEPDRFTHAPLYRMGGELRLTSQFMYGSSRIGSVECNERVGERYYYAVTPNFNVETGLRLDGSLVEGGMPQNIPALPTITYDYTNRKVGEKHYELTNHLGSVMSVITDRKLSKGTENPNDINNWLAGTEYYVPDVVQYTDYSPFGVELEGRKGVANERNTHGFQGQLLDDDVKGEGNSVNYKYRMHDPRIGRFFSRDELSFEYPHNSPYAFSENRVIDAFELEGLEKVCFGGSIWANYTNRSDSYVAKSLDYMERTHQGHLSPERIAKWKSSWYVTVSNQRDSYGHSTGTVLKFYNNRKDWLADKPFKVTTERDISQSYFSTSDGGTDGEGNHDALNQGGYGGNEGKEKAVGGAVIALAAVPFTLGGSLAAGELSWDVWALSSLTTANATDDLFSKTTANGTESGLVRITPPKYKKYVVGTKILATGITFRYGVSSTISIKAYTNGTDFVSSANDGYSLFNSGKDLYNQFLDYKKSSESTIIIPLRPIENSNDSTNH
jgi:RHS repeat-associated protein